MAPTGAFVPVTFKVAYGQILRKFVLENENDVMWERFERKVCSLRYMECSLPLPQLVSFILTASLNAVCLLQICTLYSIPTPITVSYTDPEGDEIVLNSTAELLDLVADSRSKNLAAIRIRVFYAEAAVTGEDFVPSPSTVLRTTKPDDKDPEEGHVEVVGVSGLEGNAVLEALFDRLMYYPGSVQSTMKAETDAHQFLSRIRAEHSTGL